MEELTQAPEPDPVEEVEEAAESEFVEPASEEMLDQAFGDFLASIVKYNTIGVNTLNEQITEGNLQFLLDVRNVYG